MNIIKKLNGEKVRESLCFLEHAYTPVLSQRISNFDEYASKLGNCAENYAISTLKFVHFCLYTFIKTVIIEIKAHNEHYLMWRHL